MLRFKLEEQPYGASTYTNTWARARKLTFVPTASCLHWVAGISCLHTGCCGASHMSYDWMDHISGWISADGNRVLICQPYEIRDFNSIAEVCSRFGIEAVITGTGWYGHGTILVYLTKRS